MNFIVENNQLFSAHHHGYMITMRNNHVSRYSLPLKLDLPLIIEHMALIYHSTILGLIIYPALEHHQTN